MSRVRPLPASAVATVLVAVVTVAYRMRQRSAGQRADDSGLPQSDSLRDPPLRQLPDFVEVGPDQFKQTGACTDVELERAIRRLMRQAAAQAAQARTARRDGDEQADRELMGRAVVVAGDAQALQRYLDGRRHLHHQ